MISIQLNNRPSQWAASRTTAAPRHGAMPSKAPSAKGSTSSSAINAAKRRLPSAVAIDLPTRASAAVQDQAIDLVGGEGLEPTIP